MPKDNPDSVVKRTSLRDIRARLDGLTAKLQDFEGRHHSSTRGSTLVADGLRLSQEVELLRKENAALREEVAALKEQLARERKIDRAGCL